MPERNAEGRRAYAGIIYLFLKWKINNLADKLIGFFFPLLLIENDIF